MEESEIRKREKSEEELEVRRVIRKTKVDGKQCQERKR
jgi:hypothetical protein